MTPRITRFCLAVACALALLPALPARADEMPVETPAAAGADLVLEALALLGVPYRYGGDDPRRGMDCSGLVRHVFRSVLGLDLPRNAEAMARLGAAVRREALQVGDLVFFDTQGRRYSHVGIYIGDGRFVHAPARRGQVRVEDMAVRYWRQRFNGARRLAEPPAGAAADAADAAFSAPPPASAAPAPAPPECASCGR